MGDTLAVGDTPPAGGLPGRAKALMAEEAPPATRDRELVERRTPHGKVFELSDGRMEAEIAPDPVHYRDGEGRWQEIDTGVAATDREGFGFGNTRNNFGSLFGSRSDRLVRFEVGQRHLVVGVAGEARDLPPRVEGDTVSYRDVFGTADLVYQVTGEGLKEEIVLEEAPEDPSFSFVVQMGGVTARALDDGS
ncbi:MAG: hypothetical protein ACRDVN_10760, partial [Jiangellaceae bacterium]